MVRVTDYGLPQIVLGGPVIAQGNHVWRHELSLGTMYGAINGPGGPMLGGTDYRVTG